MPSATAKLEELDGRAALRFERLLPHPPERVWEALVDPEEMRSWHPSPARIEPRAGGRVEVVETHGYEIYEKPGEVLAYEPPTLLAYTWGSSEDPGGEPDSLRFELEPRDDGCLLTLVHSFDDRQKAARDAAGWDVCLDSLDSHLAGQDDPPGHDPDTPGPWERLNDEYQERFGISPEEATPPPKR